MKKEKQNELPQTQISSSQGRNKDMPLAKRQGIRSTACHVIALIHPSKNLTTHELHEMNLCEQKETI